MWSCGAPTTKPRVLQLERGEGFRESHPPRSPQLHCTERGSDTTSWGKHETRKMFPVCSSWRTNSSEIMGSRPLHLSESDLLKVGRGHDDSSFQDTMCVWLCFAADSLFETRVSLNKQRFCSCSQTFDLSEVRTELKCADLPPSMMICIMYSGNQPVKSALWTKKRR